MNCTVLTDESKDTYMYVYRQFKVLQAHTECILTMLCVHCTHYKHILIRLFSMHDRTHINKFAFFLPPQSFISMMIRVCWNRLIPWKSSSSSVNEPLVHISWQQANQCGMKQWQKQQRQQWRREKLTIIIERMSKLEMTMLKKESIQSKANQ